MLACDKCHKPVKLNKLGVGVCCETIYSLETHKVAPKKRDFKKHEVPQLSSFSLVLSGAKWLVVILIVIAILTRF